MNLTAKPQWLLYVNLIFTTKTLRFAYTIYFCAGVHPGGGGWPWVYGKLRFDFKIVL